MHKIIQGMKAKQISEKIQIDKDLTLAVVEDKVRATEKIRRQQGVV